MGLKPAAASAITNAWGILSEFTVRCYYFTAGPVNAGTVDCLIYPVRAGLVDGTNIKAGDSEAMIIASQIPALTFPKPPDYLLTLDGVKRWDVLAGQLGAAQLMLRLVVRRAY